MDIPEEIKEMAKAEIIFGDRLNNLIEERGLEVIFEAMSKGYIRPMYRIATDQNVVGYENEWVEQSSDLKQNFMLEESGAVIDGTNPKNIEVGFEKL